MDKKPNVFPKVETNQSTVKLSEQEKIAQFEAEKKAVTQHIYEQSKSVPLTHEEFAGQFPKTDPLLFPHTGSGNALLRT